MALTNNLHLAPRLKKSRAISLLPLWAFAACSGVNFNFTKQTKRRDIPEHSLLPSHHHRKLSDVTKKKSLFPTQHPDCSYRVQDSLQHYRHTNNCYIIRSARFTYSAHRFFRYVSLGHKIFPQQWNFLSCGATATGKIWTSQIQLGLHIYVKGVGYCGEPPAAFHQGIGHAFWREAPLNINNSSFRLRCCLGRNLGRCSYA